MAQRLLSAAAAATLAFSIQLLSIWAGLVPSMPDSWQHHEEAGALLGTFAFFLGAPGLAFLLQWARRRVGANRPRPNGWIELPLEVIAGAVGAVLMSWAFFTFDAAGRLLALALLVPPVVAAADIITWQVRNAPREF